MSDIDKYESSVKGTDIGYRVEARCDYQDSIRLGDQIITSRWTTVQFVEANIGVPNKRWCPIARAEELTYPAAQALMAWAEAAGGRIVGSGLRFRLVKVKTEWSYSTRTEGHGAERSFFEEERSAPFTLSRAKE